MRGAHFGLSSVFGRRLALVLGLMALLSLQLSSYGQRSIHWSSGAWAYTDPLGASKNPYAPALLATPGALIGVQGWSEFPGSEREGFWVACGRLRRLAWRIDMRQATPDNVIVRVRSFSHKSLKSFYEEGSTKGLPAETVAKLRAMFSVLDQMTEVAELNAWPLWRVHTLSGDRQGTWSLQVTRNWRLTFRIVDDELFDVNFEDYH